MTILTDPVTAQLWAATGYTLSLDLTIAALIASLWSVAVYLRGD